MKTPNTSKTFVFDLAGVLLDWDPLPLYQSVFSGDETAISHFMQNVMGEAPQAAISKGAPMQQVLDALAAEHPDYQQAIQAWINRWHEMLTGPIGGSVSALEELRERGYRTFALGNWSREEFNWIVDKYDFLEHFDDVLLSGDCGLVKPDPAIYALAEQQFSLEPTNTVFIDDRADNVQAAIQRGWNGLVFENPRHLYLTLMEYNFL